MPIKKNQWMCPQCSRVNKIGYDCYSCGITKEEAERVQRARQTMIKAFKQ